MNQQNKRATASAPVDPSPAKRRRGRPRKDENLVQKEKPQSPQPPQTNQHAEPNTGSDILDSMVGKPVSGVIEGSFDAGYLLSVRIGNSPTVLRGLVFQPGQFTPITSANDVAPHAKMLGKPDCPNGSLTSKQFETKTVFPPASQPVSSSVPKTDIILETSLGGKELPQNNSMLHQDAQSAPAKVLLSDTLLKKDLGSSFGGNFMPREIPAFGVPNNPTFGNLPVTGLLQSNALNAPFGEKYVPFGNQFAHQFQSAAAFKLGLQSGPIGVPPSCNLLKNNAESFLDNPVTLANKSVELPKNNSDASVEGGETLQEHSESLLDNRSMVQLHSDAQFVLSNESNELPKEKSDASAIVEEMAPKSFEPSLDNQPSCQLQQVGATCAVPNQQQPSPSQESPTDNYLKNDFDSGAYLVGNNHLPQESSELQFANSIITEQNEVMQQQEIEERPKIGLHGRREAILKIASELTADSNQVPLVQDEASLTSELKSSEFSHMPHEKPDSPKQQAIQEVIKSPERDQNIGNGLEGTDSAAHNNDGASQTAMEAKTMADASAAFNNTVEAFQHFA